jgi:hypothetical protein
MYSCALRILCEFVDSCEFWDDRDHNRGRDGASEGWAIEAESEVGEIDQTYIFIASNCSFFGIISSICGASNGYVVTICVLIARWTEDLTLDFDPGEMLSFHIS